MANSLCMSNERLSVVCGSAAARRLKVKDFAEAPLVEGALINGVITNERLLTAALDELKGKLPHGAFKDMRIVLRSSQIYTKRMNVPALKQKKMTEWIAGEFSDAAGGEELLCDYMILERKASGGQAALLCAAQKPMIAGLTQYFDAQGISVHSMDTALSAQIKLVHFLKPAGDGIILLAMDGSVMDASLYVNGSFRFCNSVRLLAERGTAESAAEIARQVGSIIQFNASERNEAHITNVYVTGLRPGEDKLLDALRSTYELEAGPLPDGGCIISPPDKKLPIAAYAYAAGNLLDM